MSWEPKLPWTRSEKENWICFLLPEGTFVHVILDEDGDGLNCNVKVDNKIDGFYVDSLGEMEDKILEMLEERRVQLQNQADELKDLIDKHK